MDSFFVVRVLFHPVLYGGGAVSEYQRIYSMGVFFKCSFSIEVFL